MIQNVYCLPVGIIAILDNETVTFTQKIALYELAGLTIQPVKSQNKVNLYDDNRIRGNIHYNAKEFQLAIGFYNVCLASSNQWNRGIVFANRSAAYLAIQSYQDCIDSGKLAKEFFLPDNVMKKVMAREKAANEGLKLSNLKSVTDRMKAQLSYQPHKYIPSFARCLSLKDIHNLFGGIVTNKNLRPGDILVVEPPLMMFTSSLNKCSHCLRTCGSTQPCICGWTMFCSKKCQAEASVSYHNYECPIMDILFEFANNDRLTLRMFFKLIQRFEDTESLRKYLQNIDHLNPFDVKDPQRPDAAESFESQFRIYYATKQPTLINCKVRNEFLLSSKLNNTRLHLSMVKTAFIINLLKTNKKIKLASNMYDDDWKFLSDLLLWMLFYNTFTTKAFMTRNVNRNRFIDRFCNAQVLHGTASLFRSSCQENVVMYYEDGLLIVQASKLIPSGTELLCSTK